MRKYQIVEVSDNFNHAGSKATADISIISEQMGFQKLYLEMRTKKSGFFSKIQRQLGYYEGWNKCYKNISKDSLVLLQHPFHYPQLTREATLYKLKKKKNVRFISVVHDVEELRRLRYNDYYKKEFKTMIEIADVIIVHNEVMREWFIEKGIDSNKLINLELFDYLVEDNKIEAVNFEKTLNIAGNLDVEKCGYIKKLGELDGIKINLYGPNFDEKLLIYDNIVYHGSLPPDKISSNLICGFGLVWDGESIDCCKGPFGQYLRYNNPHKMSLYIAAGIPIVIWNGAAQAEFVSKNEIGICVGSLKELVTVFNKISKEDYYQMSIRINALRNKVISGTFTKKALESAIGTIEKDLK